MHEIRILNFVLNVDITFSEVNLYIKQRSERSS